MVSLCSLIHLIGVCAEALQLSIYSISHSNDQNVMIYGNTTTKTYIFFKWISHSVSSIWQHVDDFHNLFLYASVNRLVGHLTH